MNLWNETKSVPINLSVVWAVYKKVLTNQGGAGIDQISIDEYDANRSKHLYKLWNRMVSGSYPPPPVKEVEIDKKYGKIRMLNVPAKQWADYPHLWCAYEDEILASYLFSQCAVLV